MIGRSVKNPANPDCVREIFPDGSVRLENFRKEEFLY